MSPYNVYEESIRKALLELNLNGGTDEDPRIKAMVKTKLQEALLLAGVIYNPEKLEVDK